jgi:phage baseplate assembly protein W
MPTPRIYRVDPRDLQKNIAIGLSIPFNKFSAFKSTYSTKEQVKYNLINLLLTNKGERVENPEFGCDIKKSIFDFINTDNINKINNNIRVGVQTFIPEINLENVIITPEPDQNYVNVKVEYSMRISGEADEIQINFE